MVCFASPTDDHATADLRMRFDAYVDDNPDSYHRNGVQNVAPLERRTFVPRASLQGGRRCSETARCATTLISNNPKFQKESLPTGNAGPALVR
jgi:hypothetical protein